MKLSFEEIKTITVGAIDIGQTDEGVCFHKYLPSQINAWEKHDKMMAERAKTTTGIRLDFHTNSKNLALEFCQGEKFDIYIDGLLRYHIKDGHGKSFSVPLDTPFGEELPESRVTVYLPSHNVPGVLKGIELDDGSYVIPHKFDMKILFLGDSITQGWEAEFDSLSYANRVSRYFNADSVIQGVGGACFFDDCVKKIPYDPDWVIIAYGTNDFGLYDNADEFKDKVGTFMSKIHDLYSDKKVFVISPIWRQNCKTKTSFSFTECRHIIASEARAKGFVHIDGASLVPPIPDFYTDGLHPNDNGFSLYAENLIQALK